MGFILGPFALFLIWLLQCIPLEWAARVGRFAGWLAWLLDRRHRAAALDNLRLAFGTELSESSIQSIGSEHFKRLGENYASAIKTASMSDAELRPHLEFINYPETLPPSKGISVYAIGHFGNFEIIARMQAWAENRRLVTTYRALRSKVLDGLLQDLRKKSGILYFERTRDAAALRSTLHGGDLLFGILSDQHAGKRGLWIPFFGRHCSTTAAPAVYALRFRAKLFVGTCYRTQLAHWRLEFSEPISTYLPDGTARSSEDIMTEVNQRLEQSVRRDPANWFWVHRRWKAPSAFQRQSAELDPSLEQNSQAD
jgi:lauroyl/myristoyl acyltransferase